MKNRLEEKLSSGILLFDGAVGTEIYRRHVFVNVSFESLCLNRPEIVAFVLGVLPNIPGFLVQVEIISPELAPGFFRTFYTYAWFTSFAISFVVYTVWMKAKFRGQNT